MNGTQRRIRFGLMARAFGLATAGFWLVMGILSVATLSYINRDIEENAKKILDVAINMEMALIDQHLARVKTQAITVAQSAKLRADLEQGDFEAIARDLRQIRQAMPETHILTVVDSAGLVVARANSDQVGQSLRINGLVSQALLGRAVASPELISRSEWEPEGAEIRRLVSIPIIPTEGAETRSETVLTDALALVGAAPVVDDFGRVIGAVVAAEILNQNYSIVDEVRKRTGGLVVATIALDGVRIATTVDQRGLQTTSDTDRGIGTVYSVPVMQSLRAGVEYVGRAKVIDEWQKTIYVPLQDHTGRVIAGPSVGIPESTFYALRTRFVTTLGPVVTAGVAVMTLVALLLGRLLGPAFKRMRETVGRLAEGDLTVTDLGVRRTDEIGDLARAFEGMIRGMRELLSSLVRAVENLLIAVNRAGEVSRRLGESTQKVTASMARVAQGTQDQNRSVAETMEVIKHVRRAIDQIASGAMAQSQDVSRTSRIITEAAQAINQVAHEAQEVGAAASQALAAARSGGAAVQATLDSMNRIHESSNQVAEDIRELGRHSQRIAEIVQLISEIADQTNLLALNAAIEAARAGEHGRGFAVVAQEVRRLAERSRQATEDITALVSTIQGGVEKSVQSMEAGLKDVADGYALGGEAGRALQEILTAMERTNEKAQSIAAAAEQVAAAAMEAVAAMNQVASVIDANSAASAQMAASSEQMQEAMARIAAISKTTAAAAEEVTQSMKEMNADAEAIASSAESLAELARELQAKSSRFKI